MGLVNKSDYLYAKLLDKASEVTDELIELDDKEIIRLGLKSQDVLTVNIEHIEWANTEALETYEGTKASFPNINIYWDDETVTEASINYTMIDNVSYYLEAGNYELRAIYRDFTSTNTLPVTVIEKVLVSIEWENTNPITTQQNHKAYLPYIKLNYNDGKYKRLSSQSPGVTLSDSEYYLELGEKNLTATYKGFTTNELTINVVEEEIIIPPAPDDPNEYSDEDYLILEALEDGEFSFKYDIDYQYNNGSWIKQPADVIIDNVHQGDTIKIKHIYFNSSSISASFIKNSPKFNACGSLNKLEINTYSGLFAYSQIVNAKKLILTNSCYSAMFRGCTNLETAPELPATTLTDNCYAYMFEGCTNLTTAPELPATTLASQCYEGMFEGCTNLTTAPELPATTLTNYCYQYMFYNCTSLTTAPELPATTLAECCYCSMFSGCTSLIITPELPATELVGSIYSNGGCYERMFNGCISLLITSDLPAIIMKYHCYYKMFEGCTSLTTAPELPAETLAESCYRCMFSGCTSLITSPELPATTLASNCYYSMFESCTSLTTAPELPATTLANYCYQRMFQNCTSLTTAPELPATTLTNDCYCSMFYGCTSLTTAPELPATTLVNNCYWYMFYNCTSLTTAPELPATTLATSCYSGMFANCANLTTAPVLPATTLTYLCYAGMFSSCTSLTTAPVLLATTLATSCYSGMFEGCTKLNYIKYLALKLFESDTTKIIFANGTASNGTFVKYNGINCDKIIPKNWTVQEINMQGEIVNEYINE